MRYNVWVLRWHDLGFCGWIMILSSATIAEAERSMEQFDNGLAIIVASETRYGDLPF